MLTMSLIAQGLFLLAALVVSARVTIRSRSILKGGLCLYGFFILCIVLFSIIIPGFLVAAGVDRHVVVQSFPGEIGVLPVIVVYWIPALAIAALAYGVHVTMGRSSRTDDNVEDKSPGDE